MHSAGLLQEIGRQGDSLWSVTLPEADARGYIPLDESTAPVWSLFYQATCLLEEYGEPLWGWLLILLLIVPLLVFDAVHLVFRISLYPLVLAAWWAEKRAALWLGRRYFCAVCHKCMDDPWVCCPNPRCRRRVQPRLRPTFNSFFIRRCAACRQGRWLILGQRFLFPPAPLVCRHTRTVSGCYHPLQVPALCGQPTFHYAVVGSTVAAKHSVMAHLFHQLTAAANPGPYHPAWEVTDLELKLCQQVLFRGFQVDTARLERPGRHYTLAWTFVLRPAGRGPLLVFHNMLNAWLKDTSVLARKGANWKALRGLLLILDPYRMTGDPKAERLPQAETYSRVLRAVEEYCVLRPGSQVPFKVAVLLGLPPGSPPVLEGEPPPDGTAVEMVEQALERHEPALLALLRRTVRPGRLGFFAGPLPKRLDPVRARWLGAVAAWLAAR